MARHKHKKHKMKEQNKADKLHNQNMNKGAIALYDRLGRDIATLRDRQESDYKPAEAWMGITDALELNLLVHAQDSLRIQIEKQEFDY